MQLLEYIKTVWGMEISALSFAHFKETEKHSRSPDSHML